MKKREIAEIVIASAFVMMVVTMSSAYAGDYSETIVGEVVDIQPHYSTRVSSTPSRMCDQAQPQPQQNDLAMQIIGGVIGGVLGNQVGQGRGKTAATIGGAILGSNIGGRAPTTNRNCRTSYSRHETTVVDYSDVTVNIGNGRYFTKKSYGSTRHNIGDRVQIRVDYSMLR